MKSRLSNISTLLESIADVIIYCSDTKSRERIKPSEFISNIDTYIANFTTSYIFPDVKVKLDTRDLPLIKYYLLIIKNVKPLIDLLKLRELNESEKGYIELTLDQLFKILNILKETQSETIIINFEMNNKQKIRLNYNHYDSLVARESVNFILYPYTASKLLVNNSQADNALEKTNSSPMQGEIKQESHSALRQHVRHGLGEEVTALEEHMIKLQESMSAMTIMLADIQRRLGNIEGNTPPKPTSQQENANLEPRRQRNLSKSLFR